MKPHMIEAMVLVTGFAIVIGFAIHEYIVTDQAKLFKKQYDVNENPHEKL